MLPAASAACFVDGGLPPGGATSGPSSGSSSGSSSGPASASTSGPASAASTHEGLTSSGSGETTTLDPSSTTAEEAPPPSLCGMVFGTWMIGQPELLTISTDASEIDPVLLADGRTLLYSNSNETRRAVREGPGAPFVNAIDNDDYGLNTAAVDLRVVLSPDWLRAYVSNTREDGLGGVDVWLMTRASVEEPFQGATNLSELNSPLDDFDAQPSVDELRMYIAPVVEEGGMKRQVLMVASRPSRDEVFSRPDPIAGLESTFTDGNPTLSIDERTLIFSSKRGASHDLYVSVRPSLGAPFAAPVPLDEVNDPAAFDGEAFLSSDGCELFFASDRPGGKGKWDLYRADIVPRP